MFILTFACGVFAEKPSELAISSEQQLNQLTDFVSFLENWYLMLRDILTNVYLLHVISTASDSMLVVMWCGMVWYGMVPWPTACYWGPTTDWLIYLIAWWMLCYWNVVVRKILNVLYLK